LALAGSWSRDQALRHIEQMRKDGSRGVKRKKPRPVNFTGAVENVAVQGAGRLESYQAVWQEGQALRDSCGAVPADSVADGVAPQVERATGVLCRDEEAGGFVNRVLRKIRQWATAALRGQSA